MAKKHENVLGKAAEPRKPVILDVNDLSWISRGKNRRDVMKAMDRRTVTPGQLADELGLHNNAVSRVLCDFQRRRIAKIMNDRERIGRLYQLTRKGLNLRENL